MDKKKKRATNSAKTSTQKRRKTAGSLDEEEEKRPITIGRPDVLHLVSLPDAVILSVIDHLDVQHIVALGRTCRRFHSLCLSQAVWKAQCKHQYNIIACPKTRAFSEVYELFHKFKIVNVNRRSPGTCYILAEVDYRVLLFCAATTDSKDLQSLGISPDLLPTFLYRGKAKQLWGFTIEELSKYYKGHVIKMHSARSMYSWRDLYQAALEKYGSRENLQVSLLKRCFRNRNIVDQQFAQTLQEKRVQRYEKWWLQKRSLAEALKRHTTEAGMYGEGQRVPCFNLHSVTDDYRAGLHPLSVKLRTTHHYAEFCCCLQKWLDKISDEVVRWQMIDEYTNCLKFVYCRMKAATHSQFVSATSFFKAAMVYYGRVETVMLWQYEKGKDHQVKYRPTASVRAHQCYKKYMNHGEEEALAVLKATFERQERLRVFLDDNRWMTRPLIDRIEQEALTDPQSGLYKDLEGHRTDTCDSVLAAVKPYLDSGSDSTFVEFVHRLQQQLNAKVQTMISLVTGLDMYVDGTKTAVKEKSRGKATVSAKRKNLKGVAMRKSQRLSTRAAQRERKVKSNVGSFTDELQEASSCSQSPNQENGSFEKLQEPAAVPLWSLSACFPSDAFKVLLMHRLENIQDYEPDDEIVSKPCNVTSEQHDRCPLVNLFQLESSDFGSSSEKTCNSFGNTSSMVPSDDLLWVWESDNSNCHSVDSSEI